MPLAELFGPKTPGKPVVITFDDGFQDFHDVAFPMMQEVGFNGTVFLVANHLGGLNEWDIKIGDVSHPLMSKETVLQLHAKGVEFGSHTQSHTRLTSDSDELQAQEILGSREILERELGITIDTFCYPYGSYNDLSVRLVKQAGYRFATTCDKGLNNGSEDPSKLKRIAIRNDTSLPVFVYKLWRAFRLGR